MKTQTRIAFWNVRTLNDDSRLAQVETEMLRYNLQILGLSEVRRNGFGEIKTDRGLTFLYSGKENEDDVHENGVGLLLSDVAKKSLLDWKPISDRILTARFNTKVRKLTIVQCYAPTNLASEENKDDFYNALETTFKNIRRKDIVIVLGDLNAKVGPNNTNCERHMGRHGMGTLNENGQRFLEFCQNNDLTIGGTLFIHRDHHKYTWNSPDGITKNQIDHLAISSKWRSSLLDVRNRRGADIDSDHHLVVAEIRIKIATHRKRTRTVKASRRYDITKLQNPDTRDSFKLELRNRFSELDADPDNMDLEWNKIRMAYTEASSKVLGHKSRSQDDWISQRTWDLISNRKETHLKLLGCNDASTREALTQQYRFIRRKIYRSTRKDRRMWADNIAEAAQRAARCGNMREMYQATTRLTGAKNYPKRPLRNKEGQFIVTPEGQLRRWQEHFEELFQASNNTPTVTADLCRSLPVGTLDISASPPTEEEVENAIHSLKNGKAPGADLIAAEMLKADIEIAVKHLTPLIQKIWSSETLPNDWNKGLLVTVPKKGDLSNCNNWRGITLLSIPSKILCKIILNRLSKAIEPLIRREQAGFQPNRSCTDQINTLRIILEQASEWQREIYLTFVDFEKAFDTQILDGIMLDTTVNNRRGIEWGLTNTLGDLDYADDLCLFSHTREDMQAKLNDLQREATKRGLKVNTRKTQEMRCGETSSQPLLIDTECVDRVNKFTYLGSVVSENGGTEEDIASRIAKARATFARLRSVWQSSKLTRRIKLKIFQSNVKTVLLYGCETWKVTKEITSQLQVFVNRCLRRIIRIYWPNTISNDDLWECCNETPIAQQIKRRDFYAQEDIS
ncbi:unnamed protein product [Colias eurytheme]|nr:unnamed protein product [Colias eurytheme]